MVSQEMLELGRKSSVIREIFEYSKVRKAQIGAENVFDFSLGNPSIPAPAIVGETMRELLQSTDPVELHGYTSAAGDLAVRTRLAENITARFGVPSDPSLIYMTCGAAASLTITLKALLQEGEEVLLLAPYFPEYRVFIRNARAVSRTVLCRRDDLQPDVRAIADAITPKTRAILLNSPNNPSGVVYGEKCLRELASVLRERAARYGHPITIISDEPYRELVYDGVRVPCVQALYDDTIVCYSYSKALSLAGERIGYIAVSPRAPEAAEQFAAICGAGRSMGFVCAPSLLQKTVAACDDTPPDLTAYAKNRARLYGALTDIGYRTIRPDGAFYLFTEALEPDAEAFCRKARRYELLLVPSDDFGIEGYVRIAYCVDYAQIERSLPAFARLYEDYKKGKTV